LALAQAFTAALLTVVDVRQLVFWMRRTAARARAGAWLGPRWPTRFWQSTGAHKPEPPRCLA